MYKGRLPSTLSDLYTPIHGDYRKRGSKAFFTKSTIVVKAMLYPVSDLSSFEIFMCCLLACICEAQTDHPIRGIAINGWIILLLVSLVVSFLKRDPVLPIKTFFVDHPVICCCPFGRDSIIISGGGGGLAYGIEDTVRVMEIRNSKLKHISGIPINLFSQSNNEFYPELANELTHTEMLIGEQIPMVSLWGMSVSPKRNFVAGGNKGNIQVYMQTASDFEAPFDVVYDDEVIPDQSKMRRPFIVNRTAFSDSGLLLAATSERRDIVLYALLPCLDLSNTHNDYSDSLFGDPQWISTADPQNRGIIELGRATLDDKCGEPIDVAISHDEKFIIVATSKGYLCWLRVPERQTSYSTRGTKAGKGGPVICLCSENAVLELAQEKPVPLDELFFIRRMRLRPGTNRNKAELFFAGSCRPQRPRDRTCHGILKVTYDTSEQEPKITGPSPYIYRTALTGANALVFNASGRLMALISNERFLLMNPDNLSTLRSVARFPIGHEVDTLPTTSAAFLDNDLYLAVGSGDYSVMIVPLRPAVKNAETLVKHAFSVVFLPLRILKGLLSAVVRCLKYCLVTAAWSLFVFFASQAFSVIGKELGLEKASEL